MSKTRKGDHQKLKMLYLMKLFMEETDDDHGLTMPQIIEKLSYYGVNADRKTLYLDFEELEILVLTFNVKSPEEIVFITSEVEILNYQS